MITNGKSFESGQKVAGGKEIGPADNFESSRGPVELIAEEIQQVAQVHCQLGMTINIGNYESFRIDFGVTMPCDPKDVDAMKDTLFEETAKTMFKRRQEVLATLGRK